MIAIVNYGVGNLYSLRCSLEKIGVECKVTADEREIRLADKIILPGVGAFGDAADKLRGCGLEQVVVDQAKQGKPLLGICLGMQLLYEGSCEYGTHKGLGLIPGEIVSLREALGAESPLKVPHMGWNSLEMRGESPLLKYTVPESYVYYVHSFYAPAGKYTVGTSVYGGVEITGAVQNGNVYGAQYHPEKSGNVGLDMLRAFAEIE